MQTNRGYRSLFWPILLIGVGFAWLLGNLGVIPWQNFYSLGRLWPLLLVIIGLDILFGRRTTLGSAVIGLVTVAAIIFFLIASPSLGLATAPSLTTSVYHTALAGATSATVNMDLTSARTSVFALSDSPDLINATITHTGQVNFNVTGDKQKIIQLSQIDIGTDWLNPVNWGLDQRWEIGLAPSVPMSLNVNAASGANSFDLSRLNLTGLKIDAASGSLSVVLPKTGSHYLADINGASGSITMSLPCTDSELRLDGASGSQTINVPQGCALRVVMQDTGSGSVNLPSNLSQVGGNSGRRQTGTWETTNYASSKPALLITITSLGSGSIDIH